jgi:uncharacterized protein with von Willebrand factor type A (vWA) domain
MFTEFLYELRARGLRVGPQEAMQLSRALQLGLHGSKLDGFYEVARALCVHREQDLDGFDRAFAHHFHGVPDDALKIAEELKEWLRDAKPGRELTDEEKEMLESLDLEELEKTLRERLAEQQSRHDGGSKWVGTGGASPFGRGGKGEVGLRVGEGPRGGRGALSLANERRFRELRSDITLDTRQIETALRALRTFVREGAEDELDIAGTIDATAKNAGELELKLRPPRRSSLRVLLLLDVGGSMDPYAEISERLFSAAKRATHFKELRTLYFHNCVYGQLYDSVSLQSGPTVLDLLQQCDPSWRLIVIGDGLMSPWELQSTGGRWGGEETNATGAQWLMALAHHFSHSAWLNPEPEVAWHGTAAIIGRIFPMYRLTLDGLTAAVGNLMKGGARR